MEYVKDNRTNIHTFNYKHVSEKKSIINLCLKIDRGRMLEYMGLTDFGVFLRKLNKTKHYYPYCHSFACALRERMVSIHFISKYKDLKIFPSLIDEVFENSEYTENELITIINKFPTYINWYYVFYNKNISINYKAENYDKIYADFLKSFDVNTPMDKRISQTLEVLKMLKTL